MDHIMAMTAEELDSKSDIAAELAHRDIVIEGLLNRYLPLLEAMENNIDDGDESVVSMRKVIVEAGYEALNKFGLSGHKPSWIKTDTTK